MGGSRGFAPLYFMLLGDDGGMALRSTGTRSPTQDKQHKRRARLFAPTMAGGGQRGLSPNKQDFRGRNVGHEQVLPRLRRRAAGFTLIAATGSELVYVSSIHGRRFEGART